MGAYDGQVFVLSCVIVIYMPKQNMENISEQPQYPNQQDLQQIEIEIAQYPTGQHVHHVQTLLGVLRNILTQSQEKGWPDWLLQNWDSNVTEIHKILIELRVQKVQNL